MGQDYTAIHSAAGLIIQLVSIGLIIVVAFRLNRHERHCRDIKQNAPSMLVERHTSTLPAKTMATPGRRHDDQRARHALEPKPKGWPRFVGTDLPHGMVLADYSRTYTLPPDDAQRLKLETTPARRGGDDHFEREQPRLEVWSPSMRMRHRDEQCRLAFGQHRRH